MTTNTAGIRKTPPCFSRTKPSNLGKYIIRRSREQIRVRRSVIRRALSSVFFVNREYLAKVHEIQTVNLPLGYAAEGVPITNDCRERTKAVLRLMFIEGSVPKRIGASLEGGIMMVYQLNDGRIVEVEIENDLLISCVVSDKSSVLYSKIFSTVMDVSRFVKKIRSRSQATARM